MPEYAGTKNNDTKNYGNAQEKDKKKLQHNVAAFEKHTVSAYYKSRTRRTDWPSTTVIVASPADN